MAMLYELVLVLIAIPQVLSGTHFITFPNALIPGIDLSIRVTVIQANGPVDLVTSLQHATNNSVVSAARGTVTKGIPAVFKLKVSEDLSPSEYKVVVTGSGGLIVKNESNIRFEENSVLTFIQTDKTRFSGGQEVKYRALFMRPNLLPYQGPVTLSIHDGDDNLIEKVDHNDTTEGVVSGKLQLSREPVFGIWSVTAEIFNMKKNFTKLFEVRDYTLPKFEVKVTIPEEVKDTASSFVVSIKARFTFEADVFGNCTIQIYNTDSTSHYIEYSQQIIGVTNFTVPMTDMKAKLLMDWQINVRALVTDNATFLTMINEKELHITSEKDNHQVTFTYLDTKDYFSPGLIFQAPILVRRKGKPIGHSGSLRVVPSVFEARFQDCKISSIPQKWINVTKISKPEFTMDFDDKGFGVLNFATDIDYNRIDFELSYGTSTGGITVHAFSSNLVNLLSVTSDKVYPKVGEHIRIEASVLQNLDGNVVFEVFSRGMLLRNETVQVKNTKSVFMDMVVSAEMVPQSYIMATHLTQDGRLLQNHITLLVDGSPCKNHVAVTFNGTSFKPGAGIEMSITSSPSSKVYVLIEDERNRLFGVENDIFVDQIKETLWLVGHEKPNLRRSLRNQQEYHLSKRDMQRRSYNLNTKDTIVLTDYQVPERTPINSLPMYNKDHQPMQCLSNMIPGTSAIYTTTTTTTRGPSTSTTTTTTRPLQSGHSSNYYSHYGDTSLYESILGVLNSFYGDTSPYGGHSGYNGGYHGGYSVGGGGGGGCGRKRRSVQNEHMVINPIDPICYASLLAVPSHSSGYQFPQYMYNSRPSEVSYTPPSTSHETVSNAQEQQSGLQLEEMIRSRFPETWLWKEIDTGPSGHVSVSETVPDSMTTWVTSAFVTNKDIGFGIPDNKTTITVSKNFFLTMEAPHTIILGEEFLLQITVFNNLGSRQLVQMEIKRSDDPENPIPASMAVENGKGHSIFIQITPKKVDKLNITVVAKAGKSLFSVIAFDGAEREVIVRQPGIHRTINHPRLVTTLHGDPAFHETIVFSDVQNMIPNTRQIHVKITGDILVPTMNGLQTLIHEPTGCGEQNMVKFAPDVFITKYMKLIGQLTSDSEKSYIGNIRKGYMNELNYRRSDGSYFALQSDIHSGTWLTAYVLKCFYQAQDLITIDKNVLSSAMDWLLKQQKSDGSFQEQSPVRYIDHAFKEVRLVAFTLIALLEANETTNQFSRWKSVLDKGIGYLQSKTPHINDAYSLSIACYALAKYGSQQGQSCFTRLENSKVMQDGMAFWTENTQISRRFLPTLQSRSTANDIEATAYGLLTYMSLGHYLEGLPIVKWLTAQRNTLGGYQTTQDTVVSIQALTEYSLHLYQTNSYPSHSVIVMATADGFSHHTTLSQKNYNINHRFEVPSYVDSLDLKVTGNGILVFDVVQTFHVAKVQNHADINVSVSVLKESINSVTLHPILSWKGSSKSTMLIMEIEMPTGFKADTEFIKKQTVVRKQETSGQTLILYFDGLNPNQTHETDVKMDRIDPVVGNQACYITAYDYYEPEKQAVTTYESGVLRRATMCNICSACQWCKEASVSQIGVGR